MLTTLDELIMARAAEMAEHDGDPLSIVHIMGAASLLQGELISARDRLLAKPAGSAHEPGVPDVSAEDIELDHGSAPVPAPEVSEVEPAAPITEPEEPFVVAEAEEAPAAESQPEEPAPAKDETK